MLYPQKLHEFIKSSSVQSRGFFTKAITNDTGYMSHLHKDFNNLVWFQQDLSLSEKYWLIANDQLETPKCKVCGKKARFDGKTFFDYCSQECYLSTKVGENNNASKSIIANNVQYSTIGEAVKQTGISRYKILSNAFLDEEGFRFVPDHEAEKMRIFTALPEVVKNEAFLLEQKQKRVPIKQIAEQLNVKMEHVSLAFDYYKIETKYDQIPVESKQKLMDKTYMESLITNDIYHMVTANEMRVSPKTVLDYFRKHGLTYINKWKSYVQYELYLFIKSLGIPDSDIRYDDSTIATSIGPKEIDINILSMKIGFEFNGVWFHRNKPTEHSTKFRLAKNKGIKLIQVFEDVWYDKQELIKRKIAHLLGKEQERVYARKCEMKTLNNSEIRSFFDANHIQGHKNCSETFALISNGEIVAAMSFSGNKLERYATSKNVVGGFSKLLKFSGKTYVETFADLCWSNDEENVYTKNGFKLQYITRPNYYWILGKKRVSRISTQKHKLVDMPTYSKDKTEVQIMTEAGGYQVFDAGHAKLIYDIRDK